jgi:hypothetical protein
MFLDENNRKHGRRNVNETNVIKKIVKKKNRQARRFPKFVGSHEQCFAHTIYVHGVPLHRE